MITITLHQERQFIKGYREAIQAKLPYMEGDNKRRAVRTIRYLNKQSENVGRSHRELFW